MNPLDALERVPAAILLIAAIVSLQIG